MITEWTTQKFAIYFRLRAYMLSWQIVESRARVNSRVAYMYVYFEQRLQL